MSELENAAREHLASEWESKGCHGFAADIRVKDIEQVAVRAIMTALTQAPPGWKLVPVDLMEKIPVSRMGICAPISKEWMAERSGYINGYNRAREDAIQQLATAPEYKEGE